MSVVDLTQDEIESGLVYPNAFINAGQFTYSIANGSSTWGYYPANSQPHNGYSTFSAAQADAFRAAMGAWDALIAPNFTEVTETASTAGQIRIAFTSFDMDPDTAGYAFIPTTHQANSKDGDIWFNSDSTGEDFSSGTDLYVALLHEAGHAMGLKHPFDAPVLAGDYDTTRYTVMSYTPAQPYFAIGFESTSPNSISTTSTRVITTTPMVLDIAAIQSIYGADTTTNAGNNTYNFTQGDTSLRSIYDAGGTDTFDMSTFTRPCLVDLSPGGYSSIGYFSSAAQIAYWQAQFPGYDSFIHDVLSDPDIYTWQDNLGIAFSTTIENAWGGSANDVIQGNTAANSLKGNGGSDTLIGGDGNDTLDGGTGTDSLYGGTGNDNFLADAAADLVFESAGEGTDTVTASAGYYLYANIENLTLSGSGDIFGVGNELANTILGNSGSNLLIAGVGNDTVHGNGGVDSLFGQDGTDTLYGDAGVDYLVGGIGNDTLDGGADADALYGEDGNDTLWGGTSFDTDILVGGIGNDVLHGDSGQADYDRMDGSAGNDDYYVDTGDDLTFEASGGGTDTVYANVAGANNGVYLYANVENLVLLNTTTFGVGNELANTMTGSASGNWLLGGAGADKLNGKAGNDVLFGEGGADTFIFEHGTGGDVLGDFAAGTDKIDLTAFGLSWQTVQNSMHEVNGTTAIDLGGGDFIVLNGVASAALHQSDFILSAGSSAVAAPEAKAADPLAGFDSWRAGLIHEFDNPNARYLFAA